MRERIQKHVLETLRQGLSVLLVDDSTPARTPYLVAAARSITAEGVNTLVIHGRGIICAALPEARAAELGLRVIPGGGSFVMTVSVEARTGVTTGISAADRARTLDVLSTERGLLRELVTPGHIFPVIAREGGLLFHTGVAEAVTDLLTLAGLEPVGAFVHVLDTDGEAQSDLSQLEFPQVTLSELIRIRMADEGVIEQISETQLPVGGIGVFRAHCFRSKVDGAEHLLLSVGDKFVNPLVRVQSENPLGDLFLSSGVENQFTTHERNLRALKRIWEEGSGLFLYIRHPRRGALGRVVRSLKDPEPVMELRQYGVGCQILRSFGVDELRLLSNSNGALPPLAAFQVSISQRVAFRENVVSFVQIAPAEQGGLGYRHALDQQGPTTITVTI